MNMLVIREITRTVSKYTGVPLKSIYSPSRRRGVVRARWVAMYMVRKRTHATLEEIGLLFNRNHSSVLYGINIVEKERCLIDCARRVQEEILARAKVSSMIEDWETVA